MKELILDDVAEMFNFCCEQEWQNSEDPSKKNICYAMCQAVLEHFLSSVGPSLKHFCKSDNRFCFPVFSDFHFAGGRVAKYCDERVCMSVCPLASTRAQQLLIWATVWPQ